MAPEFAHVVQVADDSWDLKWLHPVAWCTQHVCNSAWSFYLNFDLYSTDPELVQDMYVFSFKDIHTATQFALLYG
jgi:hypothetical protein